MEDSNKLLNDFIEDLKKLDEQEEQSIPVNETSYQRKERHQKELEDKKFEKELLDKLDELNENIEEEEPVIQEIKEEKKEERFPIFKEMTGKAKIVGQKIKKDKNLLTMVIIGGLIALYKWWQIASKHEYGVVGWIFEKATDAITWLGKKIFTKWIPALWGALTDYLTWDNIKEFFTSENIFYRLFWEEIYPYLTSEEFWDSLLKAGKAVLKGIWNVFDWLMSQLFGKGWTWLKDLPFDMWKSLMDFWEKARRIFVKYTDPLIDFFENIMGYWSEIKFLGGFKEWMIFQIYSLLKDKGFDWLADKFKTEEIERYEKLQLSIKKNKEETTENGEVKWSPKNVKSYEEAQIIYEQEKEKFVETEYLRQQNQMKKEGEKPPSKQEIRSIYEKENPAPNESDYFDNTVYNKNETNINRNVNISKTNKTYQDVIKEMDTYIEKIKDPNLTPEEYDKIILRVEEINSEYIHGLGTGSKQENMLSEKITLFNTLYSGNKYTKQQYSTNNEINENTLSNVEIKKNENKVSNINKTDTTVVKNNKTIVNQTKTEPDKPEKTQAQIEMLALLTQNLSQRVEKLKTPLLSEGLLGTKHQF